MTSSCGRVAVFVLMAIMAASTLGCANANGGWTQWVDQNVNSVAPQVKSISQTVTVMGLRNKDQATIQGVQVAAKAMSNFMKTKQLSWDPTTVQDFVKAQVVKQCPSCNTPLVLSAIDVAVSIAVPQITSIIEKGAAAVLDKNEVACTLLAAAFDGADAACTLLTSNQWQLYMKSQGPGAMRPGAAHEGGRDGVREGQRGGREGQRPPGHAGKPEGKCAPDCKGCDKCKGKGGDAKCGSDCKGCDKCKGKGADKGGKAHQ